MKRILGLDLGTSSIGWALVNEATEPGEQSSIIKLGVRVNPLTTDEKTDFEKGKPLSTNANRTLKRGARRNLQRYKLRRENLKEILLKHELIKEDTTLTEIGSNTTFQTLALRAKAAHERIELDELARVLFMLNKKRGYKSNRKANNEDEGATVDGMGVAKLLYENNWTPGQYALNQIKEGRKYIPDFYRSDLKSEFDHIWSFQKAFYPEILDDNLYEKLQNQGQQSTRKRLLAIKQVYTAEASGNREEKKLQAYTWRANAVNTQLPIEEVASVLVDINNDLNKSSGYLGAISDRSKKLFFNKITVGQYLYQQIEKNRHKALKNQVFYRQDYLDEFEQIWETQAKFHPKLTAELKAEIRDVVIFYQRKLKSQKGLLDFCQFESWEEDYVDKAGNKVYNKLTGLPKKRLVGQRVIPKSSPLFQQFKVWQNLNNLEFVNEENNQIITVSELDQEIRQALFDELNIRGDAKPADLLNVLNNYIALGKKSQWKCVYEKIEGNRTNAALFNVYQKIAENEGYGFDWSKKSASDIQKELEAILPEIGLNPEILKFDANLDADAYERQPSFQLWHLLYAAQEDEKVNENDRFIYGNSDIALKKKLCEKFGFSIEHAKWVASVSFQNDYGSLSSRAIKKILPYLADGNRYSDACKLAGYNHSDSLTKEENDERILKDRLEILPKNSLRNPVVEKIINQMVNLINQVIDTYGKPDAVRIELARELKKSASERADATKSINDATKVNEDIRLLIKKDFGFDATRNDVIRYKLWEELKANGYKTLFTNRYIPREKIFSKDVDIEHIIPKAILFDDSFSNKTLAYREVNLKKSDRTAMDFITQDYESDVENYKARVESMLKANAISRGKYKKLLMTKDTLPEGFIERDLRNSQYIAKKARLMLLECFREVTATSGGITDALRSDWDLINVMKELNLPKYKALGLVETQQRWDSGKEVFKNVDVIKDWTKRNDHRHHAMDALTVAFTTHKHIQYINNLNARKNELHKKHNTIRAIENDITKRDDKGRRLFVQPMPNFRHEAKKHIEAILVSYKTKNKVTTRNVNKIKQKKGFAEKVQLTPRGQLHKETVYGKIKRPLNKPVKLSKNFDLGQAQLIINPELRTLVVNHLQKYNHDPAVAFNTKTLKKDSLTYNGQPFNEVKCFEELYTIRKEIGPDLKVEKVIDPKIRAILQARIAEYGNAKTAFSDLDQNPIWLNKEAGIAIKRVTITGITNAEALHHKKDHFGREILDASGQPIPADFVSTGNNHHVAIYQDAEGKLHEQVVSFYEAVTRVQQNIPVIDKSFNADLGGQFLFTMKQNEFFVFPSDDFDPANCDLMDEKNAPLISEHLFRVQKIGSKDYTFRHHLETVITNNTDFTFKRITSLEKLSSVVKIRLNHLGSIVHVGEY
jgi:CRISPR-associated endonuclease Csn1